MADTKVADKSVELDDELENAAEDDKKPERFYIVVTMPEEMKSELVEYAKANGTTPVALARGLLADHIGFDLPAAQRVGRASKYATEAEKKAALKSQAKVRQERTKLANAVVKAQIAKGTESPEYIKAFEDLQAFLAAHPFKD